MRLSLLNVLIIAAAVTPGAAARAADTYTITDLGTLGGTSSWAWAINASGQVAGCSYVSGDTTSHAFWYVDGSMYDLGVLGGAGSYASGINDSGQVVGESWTEDSNGYLTGSHGFLYAAGSVQYLGNLGGSYCHPLGINAAGKVVGWSTTFGDIVSHAFLWVEGYMEDIGNLGGGNSCQASGINASGQVVGSSWTTGGTYHAFLYSGGSMQDLDALGSVWSEATGINASGQVVGRFYVTDGPYNPNAAYHGFLYTDGCMQDLDTLGGTSSWARGINASGHVVGVSYTAGGTSEHAFFYSGGPMIDINAQLPPGSDWTIEVATAINDKGQIVGWGTNTAGNTHALLLTPLNPPEIIAVQPPTQTVHVGESIILTVLAEGTEPLSYRWRKDGQPLTDDTRISGGTSDTLTIDPAQFGDQGSYDVVVSNAAGSATSNSASIDVLPPIRVHALTIGCNQSVHRYIDVYYSGIRDATGLASALFTLPNVGNLDTLIIDRTTLNAHDLVEHRIKETAVRVGPGDTFLLFIGGHGSDNGSVALQIGEENGDPPSQIDRNELTVWLDPATELDPISHAKWNPTANRLVILPGCHTGSFWQGTGPADRGLNTLDHIGLLAGAPADRASFICPFPGDTQGMTPLTITLIEGLKRTPGRYSKADANCDSGITFDEIRNFVLSANTVHAWVWTWFPFDFQAWSDMQGQEWPILSEFGTSQPFEFSPDMSCDSTLQQQMSIIGSATIAGDVNGDGRVDAEDLLILAASFGKHLADPGYDPRCDFNADDCVDISDLLILAGNWGV